METTEDAYARHLRLVLAAVARERQDLRVLLGDDERAVAERFLDALAPLEQQVLARLLQRRGPWLKTASLLKYFRPWGPKAESEGEREDEDHADAPAAQQLGLLPSNTEVQQVLKRLMELGFLQPLAGRSDGKAAGEGAWRQDLEAIEQCANAAELAALHKKLIGSNSKAKHGLSSSASHGVDALTGKAALLDGIKRVVGSQRRIDGSRIPVGKLMQQIWVDGYPLTSKSRDDHVVVLIAPQARQVLLRMHRLFYFQSTPPFSSALSLPSSSDVKHLVGVALSKFHQEPTQWPGLLVFFKKVHYPSYELVTKHPVFQSPEQYVCYEMARQLHSLMGFLEQFMEIIVPEEPEPDLELKWILGESTPPFLAFKRLATITDSADENDSGFEVVESTTTSTTSTSWQLDAWAQFYQFLGENISSLDDLALAAKSCFSAYIMWTEQTKRLNTYSRAQDDCDEGLSAIPLFFITCNAGHRLARTLHIAVVLYEKQRKYQVAVLLLNELLASSFLQRKRGYWWERLALNLEHLKCAEQARQTCVNALKDPFVAEADRIAIERRYARLQGKLVTDTPGEDKLAVQPNDYEYQATYMVGRPLNRAMGEKSRFIGFDDEPCGVEQLVLQYYNVKYSPEGKNSDSGAGDLMRGGWYGVHCEGMVLGNLFGILMWDVLYASVPDVFQTPFQTSPLDFGHADLFYAARRAQIDDRLAAIENKWSTRKLLTEFGDTWNREFGKMSRFVHWPRDSNDVSLQFLLLVVLALERKSLAALLRYMATSTEFHHAQNGLPDLAMVRVERQQTAEEKGSSDTEYPIHEDSGCLNVYKYCGMNYSVNMNRTDPGSTEEQDADEHEKAEVNAVDNVIALIADAKWQVQLKLVEVKGPRDRLSDKQTLWLQVLTENIGIDTSVMHVVEEQTQVDKQKGKRKKATAAKKPAGGGRKRPKA